MNSVPVAYQKLLEITRYITAITEPDQLFQKLVDTAVEVTGAQRGYLLLVDEHPRADLPLAGLRVAAACRLDPSEIEQAEFRASRTAIMKVVTEHRPASWSGEMSDEVRSHSMEMFGLRSILCEPLNVHDHFLGVLYLDSPITSKFNDNHREILPSFAAQAAICLENIRLFSEREEAQRRKHEEQTKAVELQAYKDSLSSFLAIASHDLKGPLTVLRTGVLLLKRSEPTELQVRVIDDLERATNRAARLVSTYLDIQKLEDGHELQLKRQRFALRRLVEDEASMVLGAYPDSRRMMYELALDIPEELQISGDRPRLCQILGNLIDNAVKYSPRGGPIRIGAEERPDTTVVTISDRGLGMSEEGRKQLFGRFVRLDDNNGSIRGTGLGLFIVRRLVEAHLGTIEVDSTEGEGTTFTLSFPNL